MAKSQSPGQDQGKHSPRYLVRLTVRRWELTDPSNLTAYGFIEPLIDEGLLPDDLSDISIEIRQERRGSGKNHHTDVEIFER